VKLGELASLIRSKNAGPFSLTFDVLFSGSAGYERVKSSGVLTPQLFADLYQCPIASVRLFAVDNSLAFKVTIPRRRAQGDFGDADLHGGQQHAPVMSIEIP
jgi:Domain of unknown function (DUF4387)